MFCPECGKEIPTGSNFCLFCGAKLDRFKQFLKETPAVTGNNTGKEQVSPDEKSARAQATAWVKKGDMYGAAGSDEDAIRCYTNAIGLDPSSYDAWNRKAELLIRLGRIMEARICNENILRLKGGIAPVIQEKQVLSENYIGGISSPSLKRGSTKGGSDFAGAIGANVGGYGIYVTDKRLFVIKNQKHVFGHPMGPALGGFMREELFGGTVDEGAKTIDELEIKKEIEIPREEILQIELKKPMLLSGFISFITKNGDNPRLFIDHKSVYDPLRRLMLKFYPERIRIIE
jgi:tetratricopeptide (TPR) repeat protein